MAGYNGYSMSNNAVEAYNRGLMSLSKFKKEDFVKLRVNAPPKNDNIMPATPPLVKRSNFHYTRHK